MKFLRWIGILLAVWITVVFVGMLAFGAEPQGLSEGTPTTDIGQAAAFFGSRCGEKFAIWVLLENGHLIVFTDERDGAIIGKLLEQLRGLRGDVHDLCTSTL